jgi:hypothetical protein
MTNTKALEALDAMANRLSDTDGMYSWDEERNIIRAALSPNAVVIPRDKIMPYMLEHYKDWRDTDQEIDRHNEEGMTDLAELLAEAILEQYGVKNDDA